MNTVQIEIPEAAARIIDRLQEAGYEAYVVGGCVRDSLLGRVPEDWDITTSALPEQVKALFRRTIDTGIQHGTVTVMDKDQGYEITTYRLDGEYTDSRHPSSVSFTRSLLEDLKRRDFTINAMAYNKREGLIDAFCGIEDLEAGIIRCVGSPTRRFGEDALRIMRAVRFSAQLGFTIEEETKKAVEAMAPTLGKISKERIQTELNKLLVSGHPEYFRVLYETGITKVILPEFDPLMTLPQNHPYHCYTVGEHTLAAVQAVEPELPLRLTMLLHDVGKAWTATVDERGISHFKGHAYAGAEWAEGFLKGMKYDNQTIHQVVHLIRMHAYRFPAEKTAVRRAMNQVGPELFDDYLKVYRADTMAKSDKAKAEVLPKLDQIRKLSEEILADGDCLTLKNLAVKGKDLMEIGYKPGPEMGEVLAGLLQMVLEKPEQNQREILLAEAEKLRK